MTDLKEPLYRFRTTVKNNIYLEAQQKLYDELIADGYNKNDYIIRELQSVIYMKCSNEYLDKGIKLLKRRVEKLEDHKKKNMDEIIHGKIVINLFEKTKLSIESKINKLDDAINTIKQSLAGI